MSWWVLGTLLPLSSDWLVGFEEISLGRREGTCALQDYLVLLWVCHGEPNLRHSFVSSVLRAPVGEVAPPLGKNPNLFVDVCNIYCSGWEKIRKHWEEVAFLQVQ